MTINNDRKGVIFFLLFMAEPSLLTCWQQPTAFNNSQTWFCGQMLLAHLDTLLKRKHLMYVCTTNITALKTTVILD